MADDVSLSIGVDTAAAVKSITNLEKSAIGTADKIGTAFKAAGAALAAFVAGRAVVNFFEEGIKSAIAEEQAMARLGAQLIATGEDSDAARKSFEDLANELENTTKFGDDAVLSAAALAKSYGITNDQAIKLTKAAADLASATGDTLEGAVEQLTASYSGNVKAIGKLVPEIKGLTKDQLAAGAAVDILAARFKGAANAEIKTFGGSVIQAGNAFDDFRKEAGKLITENPTLIAVIAAVGEMFGKLTEAISDNKGGISDFIKFGLQAMVTGFTTIIPVIEFVIKTIGLLVFGLATAAVNITNVMSTISAAFALVTGNTSVDDFFHGLSDKAEDMQTSVGNAFMKANDAVDGTAGFVDGLAQKIFDAGEESGKTSVKAEKSFKKIGRAAVKTAEDISKIKDEGKKFLDSLSVGAADEQGKIILEAKASYEELARLAHKGALTTQEIAESALKIRDIQIAKEVELEKKKFDQNFENARKAADDIRKYIENAAATPVAFTIKNGLNADTLVGASVGTLGKMLEGAAGARDLMSAGAGAIGDALIPGIGGAVSSVFAKLAEGPEATKQFIKDFIAAIPDIMDAVSESIPVVVEALVDTLVNKGGAVKIGFAIARAMAGEALLKNLGKQLGVNMGTAFNGDVIAKKISEGVKSAFQKVGTYLSTAGSDMAKKLIMGLTLGGNVMAASLVTAFNKLVSVFDMVGQKLLATFGNIGTILYNSALRGVIVAGQILIENLRSAATQFGEVIKGIGTTIVTTLTDFFKTIVDFFAPVFTGMSSAISAAWTALSEGISGFAKLISDAFVGIFDFAKTAITGIITNFGTELSTALTNLLKPLSDLPGALGGVFQPFVDFLKGFKIELPGSGSKGGLGGIGGAISKGAGNAAKALGFYEGGVVYAAGGFTPRGSDTVPAMLTPGEMVLNRGQQANLFDLANNGGGGESTALLRELVSLLSQPQTTAVTAEVNGRAIADIVLQQSRQRARLSA